MQLVPLLNVVSSIPQQMAKCVVRITTLMWYTLQVASGKFVVIFAYSGFLNLNWPSRYYWNIVENGIKH